MKHTLSPPKRRLFKALTVTLALLGCLICLEIGLRLFGPKYYRFSNTGCSYFSNPRGYFDVLGTEVCDTYALESAAEHYPLVIYGFVLNDFGLPGSDSILGMDYIDIHNAGTKYNSWRSHFATLNYVCHTVEKIRLDRTTRQCYLNAFQGENGQKHFKQLADLHHQVQTNAAQFVIVLFPLLYDFHDYTFQEIHTTIHDFCRAEGIPLLDLLPAFSEYQARELWVHPIDHHPNEIAHEIAAREIYMFLSSRGFLDILTTRESSSVRPSDAKTADGGKS